LQDSLRDLNIYFQMEICSNDVCRFVVGT
jgi:hypothetical protein